MKIATWNVNSLNVRLPYVLDWLQSNPIDILCLQETKQNNEKFPHQSFKDQGFYSYHNGQNTYNGVCIISNKPLENLILNLSNFDDPQKRLISGEYSTFRNKKIRIICAYMPNGQSLESEKFIYKKTWLNYFCQWLNKIKDENDNIILTGDFNIAPEDIDCHAPKDWVGKILVSNEERGYFNKILNIGFIDSFRKINPNTQEFSWWDYRMAGYRRNLGMRIDHILLSESIGSNLMSCHIDEEPRKLERPSDHTPVVCEIND